MAKQVHPREITTFEQQASGYARQWMTGFSRRDLLKGFGAAAAVAAASPLLASGVGAAPVSSRIWAARDQAGSHLKIARGQVTDSLDPQKTALLVAHEIMWQIYDSLIYLDEQGTVHPGLATEWSFSSDNLTVTYKLREGVAFHDGTPFDASIVKGTVERHLDPATASPNSYMLGPLDSVEVIDPLTVAYHYKELFAPMFVGLGYSYCAPISLPAVAKFGDQFGRNPVGTGPYKFVSWTADDTITLAKNDTHSWATTFYTVQQPPQIDTVDFVVIPDDATRLSSLESGEVDVVAGTDAVPIDQISTLQGQDGISVYTRPAVGVYWAYLNQKIAPLDNLMVRQAINYAVDKDKLVQLVLDGNG
jgi:peptide/nickel transport system substrate-binding protein